MNTKAPGGRHLTQPIPIALPDDDAAWAAACQGRKKGLSWGSGYSVF